MSNRIVSTILRKCHPKRIWLEIRAGLGFNYRPKADPSCLELTYLPWFDDNLDSSVCATIGGTEEKPMTIHYAVERLYETGWLPTSEMELERLPNNGLRYPTVSAVVREFEEAGLELSIKPHLMFGCCRAEWTAKAGHPQAEELSGTVVGSSDSEAAVYALAKLREQQVDLRLSAAESQLPLATA